MLVIRFQRVGRKNDPSFRIVVTERRSKPKGAGLETLGSYHPKTKATVLENERILYWLGQGVKTSPTVHNLLVSKGVIQGAKINVVRLPKKIEKTPTHETSTKNTTSAVEKPVEAAMEKKFVEKGEKQEEKKEETEVKAGD